LGGAAVAETPRQKSLASVGVSPPIFSFFFLSFFRSYPSVIHAKAALANASTGIGLPRLSMEHRIKCGGDDFRDWLCIARMRRRIARTARHCERSEAIQAIAPPWIASSLGSSQ
jgi:hypothetical protein